MVTATIFLHPAIAPLEGGINFRDLGGNVAADGRRIRQGKLFRSGALHCLTENDCQYLQGIPVQHILDYRDADEVADKPDVVWQGTRYLNLPANPLRGDVSASLKMLNNEALADFDSQAFMLTLYRHLPFGNQAYQLLSVLLQNPGDGAMVQHCAVGKDRTGVGSALILFALGADEATVMEDYLLTETALAPFRNEILAYFSNQLNEHALEQFSYLMSAREEFLSTALREISVRYNSVDNWLAQEYGLDAAVCDQLRQRYLAS